MPRILKDHSSLLLYISAVYSCCSVCGRHKSVTWNAPGRTYCALSVFPSGRPSFDFTGGTCSDRSQMIWDDSKPSWLISLERLTELWEQSSSSVVLHLPSWRNHFRELAEAQCKPAALPGPARSSRPGASSEVVRPTPPWHSASCTAGISAENSLPIHHSSLPAALCCIDTSLNFRISFRVTQRDR